jgi:phosphoglucosamine mutase
VKAAGQVASNVLNVFTPLPQTLKNVVIGGGKPLDDASVKTAIEKAESALRDKGRILVRASGTEPLIRVMAEGTDETLINGIVDDVCEAIRKVAE